MVLSTFGRFSAIAIQNTGTEGLMFPKKKPKSLLGFLDGYLKPPINFLQDSLGGATTTLWWCAETERRGTRRELSKEGRNPNPPNREGKKGHVFRPLHTPKSTTDTLGKGKEGVGGGYSRTPPTV